jgi:hypothetical protein
MAKSQFYRHLKGHAGTIRHSSILHLKILAKPNFSKSAINIPLIDSRTPKVNQTIPLINFNPLRVSPCLITNYLLISSTPKRCKYSPSTSRASSERIKSKSKVDLSQLEPVNDVVSPYFLITLPRSTIDFYQARFIQ